MFKLQPLLLLLILEYSNTGILDRFNRNLSVVLVYSAHGTAPFTTVILTASHLKGVGTFYLPCGLSDILALGATTAYNFLINPSNDGYYRVALLDWDASAYTYFSPLFKAQTSAIEQKTLWFLNSYGEFEQVTFVRQSEQHKVTSSELFTPYGLNKFDVPYTLTLGRKAYNVRAQDEKIYTGTFTEALMPWLKLTR